MSGSYRRLAGLFALAAVQICFAAPATTPISDVLYNADGTPLNGLVVITWPAFTAADGTPVPASSMNVPVTNGNFQVNLIPTANLQPAVTYSVEIVSNGTNQTAEVWNVPASTTPLTIAVLLVSSSSPGGVTSPLGTTVAIGDVQGLANELGMRPVMGAGYTAARAAVIDSTGAISAAAGDPSDCVRVDGSSAPCGSSSGTGASFVDAEVPGGVVDGANAEFSLSQTPSPLASLMVERNGLVLQQGTDYSLSGSTLTFQAAAVPQPGDILQASYRVSGTGTDEIKVSLNAIGNNDLVTHKTTKTRSMSSSVVINPTSGDYSCALGGDASISGVACPPENGPAFATIYEVPSNLAAGNSIKLCADIQFWTSSTPPGFAVSVLWNGSTAASMPYIVPAASLTESGTGTYCWKFSVTAAGTLDTSMYPFPFPMTSYRGVYNLISQPRTAALTGSPAISVLVSTQSKGVSTTRPPSYSSLSRGSVSGHAGQSCIATASIGGARADLALIATNTLRGSAWKVTNTGQAYSSVPTSWTLTSGTATCSGTMTTTGGSLGPVQGNAAQLLSLTAGQP